MQVLHRFVLAICWYIHIQRIQSAAVSNPTVILRSVEDYFWRDYKGLIPSDAISGGIDVLGNTSYIGQFSVPARCGHGETGTADTIPATIKPGSDFAEASYKGAALNSSESSNTKILCSSYAYRYKWTIKYQGISTNCRYVIGGFEDGVPMYIGRSLPLIKQLGKLYADADHTQQLLTVYNGVVSSYDNYEILTYCL